MSTKVEARITTNVILTLNETEARALEALVGNEIGIAHD